LKGRLAIHEILEVSEEIRELISSRAPEHVIRKTARRGGMTTLIEDGIAKAARGLTTLDEVLRVVSRGEAREPDTQRRDDEAAPEVRTTGRRVLVVEDSDTVVAVIRYFLELEGFEVLVARDGAVGLDTAMREVPDVIVSDVKMPGMDGVEMVKALRHNPRTAAIGVLMLTSEGSVESETEGLAAGADDYILKPVEPRRLAARVKALLARAR
jgi:CheY-like chemotaxis protein